MDQMIPLHSSKNSHGAYGAMDLVEAKEYFPGDGFEGQNLMIAE